MSGKELLQRVAIAAVAGWLGWTLLSLYSPRDTTPYPDNRQGFTETTRRFLQSAIARDSEALAGMDVSAAAMAWALDRSRADPEFLKLMEAGLHEMSIRRNSESREVMFEAKGLTRCGRWPLRIYFTGLPAERHIEAVATGCEPPQNDSSPQ